MTAIAADPDELVGRFVTPGTHVHLAMTAARPNAATLALARTFAGTRSLTVSVTAVYAAAHALVVSGSVRHLITSFLGDTYPTPRPNALYRDLARGEPCTAEIWSVLSLVQRLMAGGTGAPGTALPSLRGSDLAAGKDALAELPAPGGPVLFAEALRPDITIVHGVCADRRGNVVLVPPLGEGVWSALAARRGVLATVERIVPDSVLDEYPDRVLIPGERVLAVCEAPYGAHPQAMRTSGVARIKGYRDDYAHLTELAEAGRDRASMETWYQDWVVDTGSHVKYLDKLGRERLAALALDQPPPAVAPSPVPPPGPVAKAIVLGARVVRDLVRERGYTKLLAGIGPSHLAAWLAARQLRAEGVEVAVCAEVGFYAQEPSPGDVFLFGADHRVQQFSGIAEVLGGLVAADEGRCLGVLSAGELDPSGNINTCLLPDGRWLTGSGGANDIASAVDCVVVSPASPRRFVPKVAHVTSPGHRVLEVACQFGRFRRGPDGPLRLATWLPGDEVSPLAAVSTRTGWPAAPHPVVAEAEPTAEELAALHELDPDGHYR